MTNTKSQGPWGKFIQKYYKTVFILRKVSTDSNLNNRKNINIAQYNLDFLKNNKDSWKNIIIFSMEYSKNNGTVTYRIFNLNSEHFEDLYIPAGGSNKDFVRLHLINEGLKTTEDIFLETANLYIKGEKKKLKFKNWFEEWKYS